jgi:hypothetical protein
MIYFGVEEGSKAHRLYDPVQKKIVISRDVIFEESAEWKWSGSASENLMEFQVEDGGWIHQDAGKRLHQVMNQCYHNRS